MKKTLFKTERKIGRIAGLASRPSRAMAMGLFRLIVSVSNLSERLSILLTPFVMEFGIAALDGKGPLWVPRTLINGARMRLEISEKTQRGIYFMKVYERELARFVVSTLEEGDVFIDIGANVGYFTLLAAQAVGQKGKVIACEPEEENFELLKKNIALNHYDNVVALRTAAGAENGEITLNINPLNRGGNSVLPATEYHSEGHYYTKEDIERRFGSALRQQVSLRTLDGIAQEMKLSRIKIIKVDTEGFESAVIQGAMELLEKKIPEHVICELSYNQDRPDTIETLKRLGYEACAMAPDGTIRRNSKLGRDVLFVRSPA